MASGIRTVSPIDGSICAELPHADGAEIARLLVRAAGGAARLGGDADRGARAAVPCDGSSLRPEQAFEAGSSWAAKIRPTCVRMQISRPVERASSTGLFNSGQSCCGIERAYVHRDVFGEFVARSEALVTSITGCA